MAPRLPLKGLYATRVACAITGLALLASASHSAVWVEVRIPDCADCTFEKVHFLAPSEGWVLARHGSTYSLTRTSDSGDTWTVEPLDADAAWILQRAEFVTPYDGWAPADRYTGAVRDPNSGSYVENGHNPGEDNSLGAPVRVYRTVDGGNS